MDKRKCNGGHSTKAKGYDKRKNEYKNVLNDALTTEDLTDVVKMLLDKAKAKDVKAAQILMEYYLGKPSQTINQNNTHTLNDFNIKDLLDFDNS